MPAIGLAHAVDVATASTGAWIAEQLCAIRKMWGRVHCEATSLAVTSPGNRCAIPRQQDLDGISRRDYNPSLCISAVEMQPLGQMLDDLSDLPAALESL